MPVHLLNTADSFHDALKEHTTVIIDFYAEWCAPCKLLAPVLEEFSNDEKFKNVFFAKINVDTLSDLCDELDIQAMPTLITFRHGKRAGTSVDPNRIKLEEFIKSSFRDGDC